MTWFGYCLLGVTICLTIIAWNGLANLMQWRQNQRLSNQRWDDEPRIWVLARSKPPYDQERDS